MGSKGIPEEFCGDAWNLHGRFISYGDSMRILKGFKIFKGFQEVSRSIRGIQGFK